MVLHEVKSKWLAWILTEHTTQHLKADISLSALGVTVAKQKLTSFIFHMSNYFDIQTFKTLKTILFPRRLCVGLPDGKVATVFKKIQAAYFHRID